jgi:hypothetical protein
MLYYQPDGGIRHHDTQGRLLFHILATLAEMEHELISERTLAGTEQAKAEGRSNPWPVVDEGDAVLESLAVLTPSPAVLRVLTIGVMTHVPEPPLGVGWDRLRGWRDQYDRMLRWYSRLVREIAAEAAQSNLSVWPDDLWDTAMAFFQSASPQGLVTPRPSWA